MRVSGGNAITAIPQEDTMKKMVSLSLVAMLIALVGCGKENIFSWAHKAGGSSSTEALTADGYTALRNKDYSKAIEYYSKILETDPANAEAIYGYSAATLADAGLDVSSLVANLVKQQSGAPERLAPSVAYAARGFASSSNLLPQTIIDNLPKIKSAVKKVMDDGKLPRIVKGKADGKLDPDNPDVNLNLAFCLVLRAALNVQESGTITLNSDYSITASNADLAVANDAGKDIVSAYHRILVVANKLKLGSDASINKINADVKAMFNDLKSKISGITVDIDHDYLLD